VILPHDRRAAIDCLADPFEEASGLEHMNLYSYHLREIAEWLAAAKDDRAFNVLRKFVLKPGEYHTREGVLSALGRSEDPRCDEVLIEMFSQTDRTSGMELWGDIRNPRLCDLAGVFLAERLKMGPLPWPENIEVRNQSLSQIWKLYRERKGLPAALFIAPGTSAVALEQVAKLIPDLASTDEATRKQGVKKLSRLGGGAWPHVKAGIASAQGPEKDRLEESARLYSNTLRSVEGNPEAAGRLKELRDRLHDPFDAEAFFKGSIESWFEDNDLSSISVEIAREPMGGGITVKLEVKKSDPNAPAPDQFSAMSSGGGFLARLRKNVFDEAWTNFLAPLKDAMKSGSEESFKSSMEMTKKNSGQK
jgi:hypothetical protein